MPRLVHARQQKHPKRGWKGINKALIRLYDTHYRRAVTYSRATFGNGELWTQQVSDYIKKHGMEEALELVLNGVH